VLWGNRNVAFVVVLPLALAAEGTSWGWVAALRPPDWGALVFIGKLQQLLLPRCVATALADTSSSNSSRRGSCNRVLLQKHAHFRQGGINTWLGCFLQCNLLPPCRPDTGLAAALSHHFVQHSHQTR
jgi:hypothetical protein